MARILAVSDQPDWRTTVLAALAEHEVDPATGPEQAGLLLRTGAAYDIALVDLDPGPGGTGTDALVELLWDRHPGTLRIVVAGAPPLAATPAETFARYGVEAVLVKSRTSAAALRHLVEEAVERETAAGSRIRRAELRHRILDRRQRHSADLDARIRAAEVVIANCREPDSGLRRRAQASLDHLRAERERFLADLYEVGMRIERTATVAELLDCADVLAAVEDRHADIAW